MNILQFVQSPITDAVRTIRFMFTPKYQRRWRVYESWDGVVWYPCLTLTSREDAEFFAFEKRGRFKGLYTNVKRIR